MTGSPVRFNPFPGLRSFEPREEHLFFGRERQIDELLKRLRRTRFLAVVGISGSGKSSLVLSGLIPALHRGLMTRAGSSWRVAIFRPGEDPIGNLAAALAEPDVLGLEGDEAGLSRPLLEATLRRGALGLVECVREARDVERRIPKYDNVLVVVDQFEELFRLKASSRRPGADDEALAFVRLLQEASRDKDVPIYVVLTMRTDFMEHCVEYPGLPESINDGAFIVSRMSREEQRAAIVGPVAVGGGEIAPRLVLRLLNSVGDDPDQLPVLQHALMRTWDHWQKKDGEVGVLDVEQYEAIGTMERALSQHAEEVYEDLGSERGRMIAEKMFKALTDKAPGRRGVRRPIQIREVCELTGASAEEVVAVVDRFRQPGRSFLMPPATVALNEDSVIDISHESLMRVWDRLIQWVEEETESSQFYQRLARAAALHEEGSAGLWRDPELEFALQWKVKSGATEVWARRYDPGFERAMAFLDASHAARSREQAAEERERLRTLRRARWMTAVSVVVTLVILTFALYARQKSGEADEQRQLAEQRQEIAEQQRALAEEQKVRAEKNAEEARQQKARAEESAREAEQQKERAESQRELAVNNAEEARQQKARAEQNARTAEEQKELAQRNETEALLQKTRAEEESERVKTAERRAQRLRVLEFARSLAIQTLRLQEEDQRELAALLAVQAYRLTLENGGESEAADIYQALWQSWKRLSPDISAPLYTHQDMGRALAWAPDGETVFSGSDGDGVVAVTLEGAVRRLETKNPEIRALAASPDGAWLVAGAFDGSIQAWDLREDSPAPHLLAAPPESPERSPAVVALAFLPDSKRLVSGSLGGEVLLRSLDPEPPRTLLAGSAEPVTGVAVSPDGHTLAASNGNEVRLWDLRREEAAPSVLQTSRAVRSVAFSPDGAVLAGGAGDGAIDLWDVRAAPPRKLTPLLGHTASVNSLSFSSDGDLLASASSDGTVRLWNARRSDAVPIVLGDHETWVWAVAFSPDGESLVSTGADRATRLWRSHSRYLVDQICAHLTRDLTDEERKLHLMQDIPYEKTCPSS